MQVSIQLTFLPKSTIMELQFERDWRAKNLAELVDDFIFEIGN